MNRVTLQGRLGATPELSKSASGNGTSYVRFSLATNERSKRNGTWTTETSWHRIVCFGRMAESLAQYCAKGRELTVDGKLSYSTFTRDDGSTGFSTSIIANRIEYGRKPAASAPAPQDDTVAADVATDDEELAF